MSQPLVSVVVPNFNHAEFIRERLDSIFAQSYQNFEVIILDDCSDDGSLIEIEPFLLDPRVRLYVNKEKSGSPFKQWSKGIALARGDYIWVAESDDYADGSFLEIMTRAIDVAGTGFVYCRSTDVDRFSQALGFSDDHVDLSRAVTLGKDIFTFTCGEDFIRAALCERNSIVNASAVLFESATIKKFISTANRFRYLGDWLLYIFCINDGGVALVNRAINFFRRHASTTRYAKKTSKDWEVLRTEYLGVYGLLHQIGAIDSAQQSRFSSQINGKILNRIRFDAGFCVDVIMKRLQHDQKIIIWGAGTVGSFIAESLITAGVSESSISFIDLERRTVNISGKNYFSSPAVAYLLNLKGSCDSLLILASLESHELMSQKLRELGLNMTTLNAMMCLR